MSRNQRVVLLALAAVVLVVAFVLARQSGDDEGSSTATVPTTAQTQPAEPAEPAGDAGSEADAEAEATEAEESTPSEPAEPAPPLVRAEGGQPVGGVQELGYDKGEQVDFRVRSDTDEELHIHGYEVTKALPAGKAVRVRFPADIEGRFEIELHGAAVQIAQLEVQP